MLDKIVGLTLTALVLFYIFKDPGGTANIANSIANLYTGGIKALQGR